ncbi:HEPN domain-containing protein [Chthonomonas calidirosea]|uniref:HEPN domain n=1 Tax=Chthonomonas calidirosea (strain DSM 23976 / ICMP 18418 / T49) TaxID=1303518 RepID=S0ESK4_CHTCT|nr:HEPN domain-containing protein [Chthonomonas calidirosea]CCW33859.1 HEPN domain [Chthonomonas calidirosea T49]CEK16449.1 HEPN domain-containing protein [Chthonomonas calidirosea]
MAFDWREFLDLARALRSSFETSPLMEAASRSAVSRAYYAAFCHTRSYAEKHLKFQRTTAGIVHKLLREHLGQQGPEGKEIADKLRDLHGWRKRCDYEDTVSNLNNMAIEAISTAEAIISKLSESGHAR